MDCEKTVLFCNFERSEESLFDLSAENKQREILRFAQNDSILTFSAAEGERSQYEANQPLRYLFVSASTPGSFLPPKNSRDAPPPVEMCETLSARPAA